MLISSNHKGIYEKVLTAPNGQLVRVRFEVVEVEGSLRGRVLSAIPVVSVMSKAVAESSATVNSTSPKSTNFKAVKADILFLPTSVERYIYEVVASTFKKEVVSPFSPLEFFMSQPTRAPSLV
jgi:hypothetical protein